MNNGSKLVAGILACISAPALACLPPLYDQTEAQRLKPDFDWATDIVYGVVLKDASGAQTAPFKVLYVYKGGLSPGQIIDAVPSHGFDPVPCTGIAGNSSRQLARTYRGQYGVVAFDARVPALHFLENHVLELAFKEGWIRSARAPSR